MRRKLLIALLVLSVTAAVTVFSSNTENNLLLTGSPYQSSLPLGFFAHSVREDYTAPPVKIEERSSEVTVISAGDVIFHTPELDAARENGSYNFNPMFSEVKSIMETKDIAVANFESTINPDRKLSGYPTFNTPVQALDALKSTGIDVLLSDNNHTLDTGVEGIKSTDRLIEEYGFKVVGSGEPGKDKSAVIEKNGIKIGMLSYTYGTNYGIQYKDMINYIDEPAIQRDMDNIKRKCDFVIVYLHVGTEYVRTVEASTSKLVKDIASMGADAILCSHPHVARKSEVLNVNGREVFVNYSMGNFISNQNDKYTDIGSMVSMTIEKNGSNTRIKYAETIPVYRLRYKSGGKTIFKTVLCSSIENYSNVVGSSDISYVKQVSGEIAFTYEPAQAADSKK
ncbi:MAG: CapA family protein [Bacillota bacterium]|nr:CapA family protein [Bacillota bacterium]